MKYHAILRGLDGSIGYKDSTYQLLGANPDLSELVAGGVFVDGGKCAESSWRRAPALRLSCNDDVLHRFTTGANYAGVGRWAMWWAQQGAKVGYRRGNELVWSDGGMRSLGNYVEL